MNVTVLYESIYGNTAAIADAIASGIHAKAGAEVDLHPVGGRFVPTDLLVLGAPTHAHGLPSSMSRKGLEKAAAEKEANGEALEYHPTAGMRQFIDELPPGAGSPVACFDTRFDRSAVLTGSAAKTMARKLRRHGYTVVGEPESFFVSDAEGPLLPGELERATRWGAALVGALERVG